MGVAQANASQAEARENAERLTSNIEFQRCARAWLEATKDLSELSIGRWAFGVRRLLRCFCFQIPLNEFGQSDAQRRGRVIIQ